MSLAEEVRELMKTCMYTDEEVKDVPEGEPPEGALLVDGLMIQVAFHPERLAENRDKVKALLDQMPQEFHKSGGGGWSFLNMCNTQEGEHWGEHIDVESLCLLGIGLDMVEYCTPREMWPIFPGGVPYIAIDTGNVAETPGA